MFIGVRRWSRVFPGQRAKFQASKTANICAKYFFIVLVIYIRPLICEDFEAGGTMVPPCPYQIMVFPNFASMSCLYSFIFITVFVNSAQTGNINHWIAPIH